MNKPIRVVEGCGLLLAHVVLVASAHAGANPPVLTVIPQSQFVTGMSDDGSIVVGPSEELGGGFRWTAKTGTVFIGGASTTANGSNKVVISGDGSTIAGDAAGLDGIRRASKWLGGTDWQNLASFADSATLDGLSTSTHGINNTGTIVVGLGWSLQGGALGRKWTPSGNNTISSIYPGTSTRLNGTNDDGTIVWGWNDAPSGTRLGMRRTGSVSTLFNYVEPRGQVHACGEALASNSTASIICGYNVFGLSPASAWRWNASTNLVTLLPQLPGFEGLAPLPTGLVDDGSMIVGTAGGPLPGRVALVWIDGVPQSLFTYLWDLGTVGLDEFVELGTAMAISPDGRFIAGFGVGYDGSPPGGWIVDLDPPAPCVADFDRDGDVGASDLAILLGAWGACGFGGGCTGDLDGDAVVGATDLAQLLGAWGDCP